MESLNSKQLVSKNPISDKGLARKLESTKSYIDNARQYLDFLAKIVDGIINDPKRLDDPEIESFIGIHFGQTGRDFYNIFKKHYFRESNHDKTINNNVDAEVSKEKTVDTIIEQKVAQYTVANDVDFRY